MHAGCCSINSSAWKTRPIARLRSFELGPYRETKVEGGPVTNLLVDFATVNELPHCSPPQELGGDS